MEKYFNFDRNKTLEDLDKVIWECSNLDLHLVVKCNELRKKPIVQFTIENLRIMIGQEIGLEYLIPMAIETLEENIFSEGDLYPGDLLDAVLKVNDKFWKNNLEYKNELEKIITENIEKLNSILDIFSRK